MLSEGVLGYEVKTDMASPLTRTSEQTISETPQWFKLVTVSLECKVLQVV